jgi:DeoR/GlpR family transcriptional regulator of sugar metabolism
MNKENENYQPTPLRREAIYKIIKNDGMARVIDLSERLNVTGATIRRDLLYLKQQGLIERTHGGAVAVDRVDREPLFAQKSLLHRSQKDAIAKKAASLIEDYDTIFLNSGSTTLRLFRYITAKHVKIVTNNASFPNEDINSDVEIISTGGFFRQESHTLVGEAALNSITQVYAIKSFIGLDGFDVKLGMTTPVQPEAHINRMMIEHTREQVIVLADSSKIGKVSNFFVAPITAAHIIITDDGISDEKKIELEGSGLQVIVCETV